MYISDDDYIKALEINLSLFTLMRKIYKYVILYEGETILSKSLIKIHDNELKYMAGIEKSWILKSPLENSRYSIAFEFNQMSMIYGSAQSYLNIFNGDEIILNSEYSKFIITGFPEVDKHFMGWEFDLSEEQYFQYCTLYDVPSYDRLLKTCNLLKEFRYHSDHRDGENHLYYNIHFKQICNNLEAFSAIRDALIKKLGEFENV